MHSTHYLLLLYLLFYLLCSAVSLLYAQLQAHMIPHEMANIRGCYDILRLRQQQAMDNLTNSVCCCALQLFRQVRVFIINYQNCWGVRLGHHHLILLVPDHHWVQRKLMC